MRRKQRGLARALLASFCLVWLQAAAIPCLAAHEPVLAAGSHQHSGAGSTARQGDEHASHGSGHEQHCPYCPPSGAPGHDADCGDGGECVFPHDPQVDARAAALALLPPVAGWSVPSQFEPSSQRSCVVADRPEPIPRRPLSVSYCRYLE